ncbi:hypothetical protein [Roseovarius sp.]|uniref:hypothetical protein n=1 Tax=Roseovarius sp. TaxID=1486281 RepID=UPI003A97B3C5
MSLNQIDSTTEIRNFVLRERHLAVSEREWKHRLRGYGYAIRDTAQGRFVTSIGQDAALCQLS